MGNMRTLLASALPMLAIFGGWHPYSSDSPLTLGNGRGEGGQGSEVRTASGFVVIAPATGSVYSAGEFVLVNPIGIEIFNLDGLVTDGMGKFRGRMTKLLTIFEESAM